MPTNSFERRVLFTAAVLDVLSLTHVLRTLAGRLLGGGKSWWRLLLLSAAFAIGSLNLTLQHRKVLRPGLNQPLWRSLWWVESLIRVTFLSILVGYKERFQAPPQTLFALGEALALSVTVAFLRLWTAVRGYTVNDLSVGQRTVIAAQIMVFFPLFVNAVIFHFTEGFAFDTAWNFVNHTALTVGFGNIRVRTTLGKVILVTVGNVTLIFVAFFLFALHNILPAARTRREVLALATGLTAYWMLGSLAFSLIEGWDFLDGVYFTWASLTTVGFGDLHPNTTAGSELWLVYTYIAVCMFGVCLSSLSQAIHKGNTAQSDLHMNEIAVQPL